MSARWFLARAKSSVGGTLYYKSVIIERTSSENCPHCRSRLCCFTRDGLKSSGTNLSVRSVLIASKEAASFDAGAAVRLPTNRS